MHDAMFSRLIVLACLFAITSSGNAHAQERHAAEPGADLYGKPSSGLDGRPDESIRSIETKAGKSLRPHEREMRIAFNRELDVEGSGRASDPLSADYVERIAAFKHGYSGRSVPAVGEIDGLLASVRQDNGDSNVIAANGQLVDRGSGKPGFLSLFEGHATLILPESGTVTQDVDVQLGGINSRDRSSAELPSIHGLHAFKEKGNGGTAIYIDSHGVAQGDWDYGLQIRRGGLLQLAQRSSDAGIEIFADGSEANPFLLVNTARGLRLSGVGSASAARVTPDGRMIYDHGWTRFTPVSAARIGVVPEISSSGKFSVVGNICTISLTVSIGRNGTGASNIVVTGLPEDASGVEGDVTILYGRESAVSGTMIQGILSGRRIEIYSYDNGYPGRDGAVLRLNGSYECSPR